MTDSADSGTPLARKLRIKPGHGVALRRAPADWPVPAVPEGVRLDARPEEADVILAFCRTATEVRADAEALVAALRPQSCLWLLWPRRAAGHTSDITDNDLRDLMLPFGVVDVKVAAVGVDWSGLAFVWRKENRPTR